MKIPRTHLAHSNGSYLKTVSNSRDPRTTLRLSSMIQPSRDTHKYLPSSTTTNKGSAHLQQDAELVQLSVETTAGFPLICLPLRHLKDNKQTHTSDKIRGMEEDSEDFLRESLESPSHHMDDTHKLIKKNSNCTHTKIPR